MFGLAGEETHRQQKWDDTARIREISKGAAL